MKKSFVAAVLVAFTSLWFAGPAFAQIEDVVLQVDGLSCPFCAFGLEKKITKINGVNSYEVSMRDARVFVSLAQDAQVDLNQFRKAVKEAGFTVRGIVLRVKGTITKTDIGFALEIGGNHEPLLLFENSAIAGKYHRGENPKDLVLGEDLNRKLADYAREGKKVLIEGPVHEHAGLPAGLSVEKLEAV